MHQRIFNYLQKRNTDRKISIISRFIGSSGTLLDFGCGDLSLAKRLYQKNPHMCITGVDVVDFEVRDPKIFFRKYGGKKLPFQNNSFDVVIAWHVFHHTPNPLVAFRECIRVAKQRVIFVEPVWRHRLEVPGMMFMDWLFNVWKSRDVTMAFAFRSRAWWEEQITRQNGRLKTVQDVEMLLPIFPAGRSLLFIVDKGRLSLAS